jgi:hypothetical protein
MWRASLLGVAVLAVSSTNLSAEPTRLTTDPTNTSSRSTSRAAEPDRAARAGAAIRIDRVPLVDVLDQLRASGLNLAVNWAALEVAGVSMSDPISLQARGLRTGKLLDLILRQTNADLAWYVDDNVVHITTRALADRRMITRVYVVSDLLVEVPNFVGPKLNLGAVRGSRGGSGLIDVSSNDRDRESIQDRGDKLVDLIVNTIRPEIWQENGGPASIRFFAGQLVITAPASVHAGL